MTAEGPRRYVVEYTLTPDGSSRRAGPYDRATAEQQADELRKYECVSEVGVIELEDFI